jgi:hypothetical protein
MAINIYRYRKINNNLSQFDIPKLQTFVPEITEQEYLVGSIKRFFIQKSNDDNSGIFEVNREMYAYYMQSPFFIHVAITWRLSGTQDEIWNSNQNSIKYASANMKNLKLYLANPLQFSKQ